MLALAGVTLALVATPSFGQTVEELTDRVAEFELRWQDARRVLEASEAAARPTAPLDTIRAGRLTVIGTEGDLSLLRPGIAPAWDALRESLGSDTSLLDRVPLTVTRREVRAQTKVNMPTLLWYLLRILGEPPLSDVPLLVGYAIGVTVPPDDDMVANVRTSLDPGAEESAQLLIDAAWGAIGQLLPPEVVAWGGSDARPARVVRTATVYRDVLTSTVRVGAECLKGDVRRCQDGLGLSPAEEFDAWYDAEDLRRWVAGYRPDPWGYATPSLRHRECVDDNVIDACRDFLHGRLGNVLKPPFDLQSRQLALAVAVDMGGDGAIGRLVRSDGSMAQRLESVAGAPLDAITSRWRAAAVEAAGQSIVLSPATAVFALMWVLLFGMAGARNAQWR